MTQGALALALYYRNKYSKKEQFLTLREFEKSLDNEDGISEIASVLDKINVYDESIHLCEKSDFCWPKEMFRSVLEEETEKLIDYYNKISKKEGEVVK